MRRENGVFSAIFRRRRRRGGGFKRRHLYQSGKGVSSSLTKPRPKRVNGVFVRWTQELAVILLKKEDTLSALVQMAPFKLPPLAVDGV